MPIDKFAFMISGQLLICSSVLSASSSAVPDAPLVVDQNSHIIVMEYEAWFGPNAVTFQGTAALPLLAEPLLVHRTLRQRSASRALPLMSSR
jgi:hypothetical protein